MPDDARPALGLRLAVLADNEALPGFQAEHGLSLALTLPDGGLWLWDTGRSDLFLEQARRLDVEPATARGLALSHGHYDHTGGLEHLLRDPRFQGQVAAHPAFAIRRCRRAQGPLACDIGCPCPPGLLDACRLRPAHSCLRLDEGLYMVAAIPREPGRAQAVDGMCLDPEGRWPDGIPDDACLVFARGDRMGVILGCCHSGLANTLARVRHFFGDLKPAFVLGGLHLNGAPAAALDETARTLVEHGAERVFPGHCTGREASEFLRRELPVPVAPLASGLVLDL